MGSGSFQIGIFNTMALELAFKVKQAILRFSGRSPAQKLIFSIAITQRRLLAVSILTTLVAALSEGLTLAIIYLSVQVLAGGQTFVFSVIPIFGQWFTALPQAYQVITLMSLAVVAQGVQSVMRYLNRLCISYFTARCRTSVTSLIHDQIMRFSFPCASHFKVGELTTYSSTGSVAIQAQIESISDIGVNFLVSLIYIFVLLKISTWLLFVSILLAIAIASLQRYLEPKVRRGAHVQSTLNKSINAKLVENYQALRLLHVNGQLHIANGAIKNLLAELEIVFRLQARRLSLLEPVSSFLPILAVGIIVIVSVSFWGVESNRIIPSLVTFVLALQRLNTRLSNLASNWTGLANNSGKISLTNEILRSDDKEFRRLGGTPYDLLKDRISFENVSLVYPQQSTYALKNLNFEIIVGNRVALVGPSGSGKSSIADLLVGLYNPSQGRILIDNADLNSIDLNTWQHSLGVVSQDTFLFNASIADNLKYGLLDLSDDLIVKASINAQAHAFIQALPDGYDTIIGERGYRLSGGQRQRISLARAFLRHPDILILDEATSALDTESEKLVQRAIQSIDTNCTLLVIAHRLSTIVDSDLILVLDQGQLIQSGTHIELINQAGLYRRLWKQQSDARLLS